MSIHLLPPTPPHDHKWIRQVFSTTNHTGRQLVLHDNSKGLNLPPRGPRSLNVAAVSFDHVVGNVQPDDLASPVRMVAHIGGTREDVVNLLTLHTSIAPRLAVILEVSSQEAVPLPSIESTNFVWLSMKSREAYKRVSDWLPQFLDLSFKDAVKIAKATDRTELDPDLQQRYAQLLDITHPGDPSASLAFRLFCEAWTLNNGQTTKHDGISITPPDSLDRWVTPFKVGTTTSYNTAVAAMMGTPSLRAKAADVLNAAERNDQTELKSAADAFVFACSPITQTPEGAR
jgi:hypothetical protein